MTGKGISSGPLARLFRLCVQALAVSFAITLPVAAIAAPADVIAVKVARQADGSYRFDVTVRSDETGWDKYADRWEVLDVSGKVIAIRELAHPHVDEQPFTRNLSGVAIPAGVSKVTIRAHDKIEGYGGQEMTVPLP